MILCPRRTVATVAVATLAVLATQPIAAQQPPAAGAAPPCSAAEHRQFDFWTGEWDVATKDGKPAGRSRVTPILGGCALLEEWTSLVGPSRGQSFNIYDARTRRWHQSWVDNSGLLALFDGALRDGAMVLEGDGAGPNGGTIRTRMTFTPLADGRVRQLWESSADKGTTWTPMFDGYYSRARKR